MAVSPLATESYPADKSNYTVGRTSPIHKITVHHMAGRNTAQGCGAIFQNPGRNGSSHYGIGYDGKIANYVDEDNTAWTDSSWYSNCTSVTIENSNSAYGAPWNVTDETFNSLVKLCADIAKRHNLGLLIPGKNLTWHSMYTATTCCGDYLRNNMQRLADEANKIINGAPTPTPEPEVKPAEGGFKMGDEVVPKEYVDYYGTHLRKTRGSYFLMADPNGDRAVLVADSVNGPIYAAMKTSNLNKVGDAVTEAPAPKEGFNVGDKVLPVNFVDYSGTRLLKTRDFYFINQIKGDRAVLTADNVNGGIYAAVNTNNLRKV